MHQFFKIDKDSQSVFISMCCLASVVDEFVTFVWIFAALKLKTFATLVLPPGSRNWQKGPLTLKALMVLIIYPQRQILALLITSTLD
jgi:hypothetical protein